MVVEFRNEPATDFTNQENQQAFKDALIQVQAEFGTEIPLVINGEKIFTDDKYDSVNPADHQQVLGRVSKASKEQVDQAMEAAKEAYKTWRNGRLMKEQNYCFVSLPLFVEENMNFLH